MSNLWLKTAIAAVVIGGMRHLSQQYNFDKDAFIQFANEIATGLGYWAIPAYVAVHTLTLAFCLPYAVFFEAAASLLFGFVNAVLCVFAAKILGASLSFWIGRLVLRKSSSATKWAENNKYFGMLSRGVERDGWKFVLLARFSPIPSYVINYALAATKVRFLKDFLLPTIVGCLPMILQNTSIGSLAGAAVASASGSQKSQIWSYMFPSLGIASSVLISMRIKKYSADILSVPLYLSEMAPYKYRGALNIGFQLSLTIGILVANVLNYFFDKIKGGWGWRLCLGGAVVPALIITIGSIVLPDTPNSLIDRAREE